MSGPPSARWPGLRAAASGLLSLLLPLPWLLETSSCEGTHEVKARTGLDLLGELEPVPLVVLVLGLGLVVALPFLARGQSPARALLLHLAGLLASGCLLWLGWMVLFFTLFTDRTLRPAGAAVVGALGALGLDALVRAGLSGREWWSSRQAPATADDATRQR